MRECDLLDVWTVGATLLLLASEGAAADEGAADEGAADEGAAEEGLGMVIGKPALAQMPERTEMTFSWSAAEGHAFCTQGVTYHTVNHRRTKVQYLGATYGRSQLSSLGAGALEVGGRAADLSGSGDNAGQRAGGEVGDGLGRDHGRKGSESNSVLHFD